jgi:hypothetical protein
VKAERGRMSQTLMKSERDLGAMLTLNLVKDHKLRYLKMDLDCLMDKDQCPQVILIIQKT